MRDRQVVFCVAESRVYDPQSCHSQGVGVLSLHEIGPGDGLDLSLGPP